ncbi:hypothetical protein [Bradyrhizobium sp. CCBAU 45384]|uniref:hypothetical protein n=1 Tax=Bradyrhizobium sp. CCBAU 45384 TaxID=858428 RepID=UPI0023065A8A|nr:hypothetical protein [Bradyrhizobium sp. CCBAU 45384]
MHERAFDLAGNLVSYLGAEDPLGIGIACQTMLSQSLIQARFKLYAHGVDEPLLHSA